MEVHIHRLLTELISGNGSKMIVHPEMDKSKFPEAQYEVSFSEENTRVHFEKELIDFDRPLSKNIFLIGSTMTDERPVSYSMPYDIESMAGSNWNRSGHDGVVEILTTVRVSMIVEDKVIKQAYAQLRYMQLFAQQAIRNPPTQDWWSRPAHLIGFTSIFALPHENLMGFNEEEIQGRHFGARFSEYLRPSEHIAIRKL